MKKYVSLLLILMLMFSLCSCSGRQPDPPAEVKTLGFGAQYIRTDGYHEDAEYPAVQIIRSKEQLNNYYEANNELYYFGTSEPDSFAAACERYDDTYFQEQILILILLEESSGSNRHKVQSVSLKNDMDLTVEIERILPKDDHTDDMAEWHIMIEPAAGIDVVSEENVTVLLK